MSLSVNDFKFYHLKKCINNLTRNMMNALRSLKKFNYMNSVKNDVNLAA